MYTKIHFNELIPKETLLIADEITRDIDYDDVLFVALTIHFNCKLWTGDKALMSGLKKKGFKKFISTKELMDKIRK